MTVASGWIELPLDSIAAFRNGGAFSDRDWTASGLPIIRIQNLNGSPEFNHYDGAVRDELLVRTGDLLFGWSGSRGTSFGAHVWSGPLGILNQHIFRVEAKSGIDPSFLGHLLTWVTPRIENHAHGGSGLVHVTKRELLRFRVVIPQLPSIQRRIASLANCLDRQVRALEVMRTEKRRLKRALMQRLFERGSALWALTTLGDTGQCVSGATPDTTNPRFWDGDIPWCTPTDVTKNRGVHLLATARTISSEGLRSCATSLLPEGSVVVCTRATVGAAAITMRPTATNQGFKSIIPNKEVDASFLYYAILAAKTSLVRRAGGSTFPEVSTRAFSSMPIRVPELAVQARVARALRTVDDALVLLDDVQAALGRQKRAVMQKLLSGEIELPEVEKAPMTPAPEAESSL